MAMLTVQPGAGWVSRPSSGATHAVSVSGKGGSLWGVSRLASGEAVPRAGWGRPGRPYQPPGDLHRGWKARLSPLEPLNYENARNPPRERPHKKALFSQNRRNLMHGRQSRTVRPLR